MPRNSYPSLKTAVLDLSVVIPVHNGGKNVPILAREIELALNRTPWSWECVWVDDGSTDDTVRVLEAVRQKNPRQRAFSLDRRHGQSTALHVGFKKSRGRVIVTIDGDGQNNPSDIPLLADMLFVFQADMVNGYRNQRYENWFRRSSALVTNRLLNWITGEKIRDIGCALRVFRRECLQALPPLRGVHRFIPALVRLRGFNRIQEMPVGHRPRFLRKIEYGIGNQLWPGLIDALMIAWVKRRWVRPKIASIRPLEQQILSVK